MWPLRAVACCACALLASGCVFLFEEDDDRLPPAAPSAIDGYGARICTVEVQDAGGRGDGVDQTCVHTGGTTGVGHKQGARPNPLPPADAGRD